MEPSDRSAGADGEPTLRQLIVERTLKAAGEDDLFDESVLGRLGELDAAGELGHAEAVVLALRQQSGGVDETA